MAKKNNNTSKDSREKLELAQKIADNSQKVVRTYANLENGVVYFFRRVLSFLNKIVFDSKFSKIAALILAVILYFAVNANNNSPINVTQASQINDIPVQVIYNSEMYEVTGIPQTANVIVTGDMADITLQKSQVNARLTADLSGLTEGVYTIKLTPTNFISRLSVNVIDAPSVTVTIKKKVTTRLNISFEFINTNKMDNIYSLGEPTFDNTEVLVRASQDTIDEIAFVKALIDVTDVTSSFTRSARLVAYNQKGEPVTCDIIPETVNATVTVTSPSKEVPIIVRPVGVMPEGLAIDEVILDYSTVMVYAPDSVLETIECIYIDLDVSSITKNTVYSTAIAAPSGTKKISVTRVNMEIVVGEAVSKIVYNVPTRFVNNTKGYKPAPTDAADAEMNILVTGTQKNLDAIGVDNIFVDFDLTNVSLGTQQVPILVYGNNPYVHYETADGREFVELQVKE